MRCIAINMNCLFCFYRSVNNLFQSVPCAFPTRPNRSSGCATSAIQQRRALKCIHKLNEKKRNQILKEKQETRNLFLQHKQSCVDVCEWFFSYVSEIGFILFCLVFFATYVLPQFFFQFFTQRLQIYDLIVGACVCFFALKKRTKPSSSLYYCTVVFLSGL